MSTLKFNEDGPVAVSAADFAQYKRLKFESITEGYYTWIDENYTDGVRRLALRDVVRRNAKAERCCHKYCCGNIFMANSPKLFQTLQFRPRLLREFCEELLYVLEQKMGTYQPTVDEIVAALLVLCDSEMGQKFWPYHSLHENLERGEIRELLQLVAPSYMPDWLRKEVWQAVIHRAAKDLQNPETIRTIKGSTYREIRESPETTVSMLADFVSLSMTHVKKSEIAIAEQAARWLDDNLPSDVVFDSYIDSLMTSVKRFNDWELAYRILRRHLMNVPAFSKETGDLQLSKGPKYYLWLHGLIMEVQPDDRAFLVLVQRILEAKRGKLVVKFK